MWKSLQRLQVVRKRSDILVGGILGSFAYNLLVTLGLAAAIRSIPVDPQVTFIALPVMVGVHRSAVVGTAEGRAEDLAAGETDIYTLQGSLTQPTWSTVSATITRVSENVEGQGSD